MTMEAPVLSKNQMKNSLSKGKKSLKKSIRNVLSKPKTLTWPLISLPDSIDIITKLKELLNCERAPKVKWSEIENVPRDQRKEVRNKITGALGKKLKPETYQYVVFGTNCVLKHLVKDELMAVLISSDVNPNDMVKPVWYFCNNKNVPMVVVPNLRTNLAKAVGFPVLTMGIKSVEPTNPLYQVYENIYELEKPFIKNRTELDNTIKNVEIKSDLHTGTDNKIMNISDESESEIKTTLASTIVSNIKSEQETTLMAVPDDYNDFYLKRTSKNYKCFVPEPSEHTVSQRSEWQMDFIQLDDTMIENKNDSENSIKEYSAKLNDKNAKPKNQNTKSNTVEISAENKEENFTNVIKLNQNAEIEFSKGNSIENQVQNLKELDKNEGNENKLSESENMVTEESIILLSDSDISKLAGETEKTLESSDISSSDSSTKNLLQLLQTEIASKTTSNDAQNPENHVSLSSVKKNKKKKKGKKNKIGYSLYKPISIKRLQANSNRKKKPKK